MKIDVYDFDGTIYKDDSTIDFYLYCIKHNFHLIKYLPIQFLYFIKYKLHIVEKENFKEKFFLFLNGIKDIDIIIDKFWQENEHKIYTSLLKKSTNPIYIISASPEFLLKDICKKVGAEKVIATNVDKHTGKFKSKNCYGREKIERLNYELNNEYIVENFYSDSLSDSYLADISISSYLVKKGKVKKWKKI